MAPSPVPSTRALWQSIMSYASFDRMPIFHWGAWTETRERWRAEGFPADRSEYDFFHADGFFNSVQADYNLLPPFPEETLEETTDYRVYRDPSGVLKKTWKDRSSIPQYMGFTLNTAADWDNYKARLQPDPRRLPLDLPARAAAAQRRDSPLILTIAPIVGWIRNWMGVENLAYLTHDSPDVFADMTNTMADLSCWSIDQVMPHLTQTPDLAIGWEDICGRSGPLISPAVFNRCVAPAYRKVREKLDSCGVHVLGVDCDGWIEPLLGPWLDCGVNLHFPIEIGVWNADPMALRRKYGRDLRLFGGIDKRQLSRGRPAIDAELERRRPLMAEGGYVPLPDHLIPPEVSLDNYQYYLDRLRSLRF